MKKVRILAPFPPPLNGHSYMALKTKEILEKEFAVSEINLFIKSPKVFMSLLNIIRLLIDSFMVKTTYLTISETLWGNIKDLFFYTILYFQRHRIIVHLHGGSIKKELWNKYPILFRVNKFFLSDFKAVIVSSKSHKKIFNFLPEEKIHAIENFTDDEFKISKEKLNLKLDDKKIKILYCSGMRKLKGYHNLLKAYKMLPDDCKNKVQIDFVGPFEDPAENISFNNEIKNLENIKCHGFIPDSIKTELFHQAHIFCFPSLYNEGQPVSIIESLYSGCAIIASKSDGTCDMLDSDSCYFYEKNDIKELSEHIKFLIKNDVEMKKMIIRNVELSKRFSKDLFSKKIIELIEL